MGAYVNLLRQWSILKQLSAAGSQATVRELVEQSGVSDKTIRRDLELLREVGFPLVEVVGERGRKHWQLADGDGLLQLKFTLEEAAALYLGRQFLEPLAGTYFFDGAQRAFQKIRAVLGDSALKYLEKLAAIFYCKSHGWADYSRQGELIDDLQIAVEDRRLTVIEYQSLRSTEPVTHYDIHPLGLAWYKHAIYLIAWSLDHEAIRTFKVDRIRSAETQQLQFTRPADFDLAKFLANSFGIFQGDGPAQQVRVRFSAAVARILSEKSFHPSQQLHPQADGSVVAKYELSTLEEFRAWILSFGAHAEVLEPVELRKVVLETVEQMRSLYAEPTSLAHAKRR